MEIKEMKEVYAGLLEIQGLSTRMQEIKGLLLEMKEMEDIYVRMMEIKKKVARIKEMNDMSARLLVVKEVSARTLELKGVMKKIILLRSKFEYVLPNLEVEAKHPSWVELNDSGFESLSHLKMISFSEDSFFHLEMKFCDSFNTRVLSFASGSADLGAFSPNSFWIQVSELWMDLGYVFNPGGLSHNLGCYAFSS